MLKKVLIIDQLNIFMRSYIVDPSLSSNGNPIGGTIGSLKSLQKFCREIKPDKIISCFDGFGGSSKRKTLNKEYKKGRTPPKLNWDHGLMNSEEKDKNKIWQLKLLTEYYDLMPIVKFNFDNIEADDIIASVKKLKYFENWNKIILSSDKDFIQLLDSKTILYRPVQQEILNVKRSIEKYGIHPNNFCLTRSICGDESDNISGIKGSGITTISKRFPFLKEEKEYYISDIVSFCEEQIKNNSKIKIYQSILEEQQTIKNNYKLMQLSCPNISYQVLEQIKKRVEEKLTWQKTNFDLKIIKNGFNFCSWDSLSMDFNRIIK